MSFNFEVDDDADTPNGGRRALVFAVIGFVLVMLLVVYVLAGPVRHAFNHGGDYSGEGSGSVVVVVQDGDSASTIGSTLAKDGVVRSGSAFAAAAALNPKSRQIGPGTYRLHEHMQASLAVSLMLDPASLVSYRVTIPEGFTAELIIDRIAKDTPIKKAALRAALADPGALGLPSWANGKVEGFLFPATYDIQPGEKATQVLAAMVTRFDQAATEVHLTAGAKRLGLSPYVVVTLASMVQHEALLLPDFPKIAEVFINRLNANMPLGSDATLLYYLGPSHDPLTQADLQTQTPYNTRLNVGPPPTPIDSPGDDALNAVLHHRKGPYLYFVTIDKAGHTAYATTLRRFNQLVAKSKSNGVS
jgi:UPF0755 protein